MLLGYNTNGFAHHRLEDALAIVAELGYGSVALTLDHHVLNPFEPDLPGRTRTLAALLRKLKLRCVVETGARFLLDPRRKHQPTLLDAAPEERQRRLEFLRRALAVARDLGADCVSFWSGAAPEGTSAEVLWDRLSAACAGLCDEARQRGVRLGFEPEPGMFVDTMARFAELRRRVPDPQLGLTLDIGHLHCQGEEPIAEHVERWRDILWNVHIEDMRRGVHDHLMFGEGDIEFPPVFQALANAGYQGGLHVELSRHSHDAVASARRARDFLAPLLETCRTS